MQWVELCNAQSSIFSLFNDSDDINCHSFLQELLNRQRSGEEAKVSHQAAPALPSHGVRARGRRRLREQNYVLAGNRAESPPERTEASLVIHSAARWADEAPR